MAKRIQRANLASNPPSRAETPDHAPTVLSLNDHDDHLRYFSEVWRDARTMPHNALHRLAKLEAFNENVSGLLEVLVTDLRHRNTAEVCANVEYQPLGRRNAELMLNAAVALLNESSSIFEELRTPAEEKP